MSGTAQLVQALHAEGGLLAAALRTPPDRDAGGAPATSAPPEEPLLAGIPDGPYALALAAVREGYRLHYADGRVVDDADPDLALLGGDRLYALALAELVAVGDLDAVAALAELISDCARAHADGDPAQTAAAWDRAVAAVVRNRTR
jgi:hypothetical protein